jgi:hypothetical protein
MNSTGNDIVSLNAIDIARTRQQRFYSKIFAPSESTLYNQRRADIALETFVWLLWSVKESAYKFLKRNTLELVFSPTRCVVTCLEIPAKYQLNSPVPVLEGIGFDNQPVIESIVTFGFETLYSRSIISRDFIFSVVSHDNNFDSTGWGIKRIDNVGSDSQSTEVRAFLLEKLKNGLSLYQLQVHKNAHDCPVLINGTGEIDIPVSLAHHDNWIAYSYQLDGVVA